MLTSSCFVLGDRVTDGGRVSSSAAAMDEVSKEGDDEEEDGEDFSLLELTVPE